MELLLGELDECVPSPHGMEEQLEDREIAALVSAFLRTLGVMASLGRTFKAYRAG